MAISTRKVWVVFLLFALSGAPAIAASFQPVTRVACPSGEFVVDARPYKENEAGSSQVQLRYRYRDTELPAIEYEAYYKNLDSWLYQGSPRIYSLGLNLDISGDSKVGGRYDRGDTLYLPPFVFSQTEAQSLFDCLAEAQQQLRNDFEGAVIRSSTFLGLMKTKASTQRNGIARLVYADAPLTGIYGRGWLLILVERGGRVLLHTQFTANSRVESVVWGQVVAGGRKPPVLQAQRYVQFDGEQRDMNLYLRDPEKSTGRQLQDDYSVEWR